MKNFAVVTFLLGLLTFSSSSQAFVTLFCGNSHNPADYADDDHSNNTTLFIEKVTPIDCISPVFNQDTDTGIGSSHEYTVEIKGYGIGLRGAWYEGLTIICPTVRAKALGVESFINRKGEEKDGVTDFYGVKASAAALFGGLDGAVFANQKGGACVLAGIQLIGLGAGVSFPKITIKRNR